MIDWTEPIWSVPLSRSSMAVARRHVHDPGPPVTIRGITYPTEDAAAGALGVSRDMIAMARRAGALDRLGLPRLCRYRPQAVPTIIRNYCYPSRAAAARAIGVTRMAVSAAARCNRLDRVGLCGNQPIEIRGVKYKNRREAAVELGVHYVHLCRSLVLGKTEFLGRGSEPARQRVVELPHRTFNGWKAAAAHLDCGITALRKHHDGGTLAPFVKNRIERMDTITIYRDEYIDMTQRFSAKFPPVVGKSGIPGGQLMPEGWWKMSEARDGTLRRLHHIHCSGTTPQSDVEAAVKAADPDALFDDRPAVALDRWHKHEFALAVWVSPKKCRHLIGDALPIDAEFQSHFHVRNPRIICKTAKFARHKLMLDGSGQGPEPYRPTGGLPKFTGGNMVKTGGVVDYIKNGKASHFGATHVY